MKPVSRIALVLTLAASLVLTTGAAFAGQRGFKGGRHHGQFREKVAQELGITEQQRAQFEEIRKADQEALGATRKALGEKRKELEALMSADAPDRAAIDAKIREVSHANEEMMRTMADHRLKMQTVLTPEQRTKARAMREQMKQRRGERRDGRQRLHRGPKGDGQPAPAAPAPDGTL